MPGTQGHVHGQKGTCRSLSYAAGDWAPTSSFPSLRDESMQHVQVAGRLSFSLCYLAMQSQANASSLHHAAGTVCPCDAKK